MVIAKGKDVGDFCLHYESEIVCFESGLVENPAIDATEVHGLDLVGHPVKGAAPDFQLAKQGDTPTGWICTEGLNTIASGEKSDGPMRILVRGPSAVLESGIPATDFQGTTLVTATQVTALEGAGITVRQPHAKTETQTT